MWEFVAFSSLFTVVAACAWKILYWVWFQPRKMEKMLRNQGMKGNSYKFLLGDDKETSIMYQQAYSKPIALDDDIVYRVMPSIVKTIKKYGEHSFSWVGPRPRIFVMNPEFMREVLNKYRTYQKIFKVSDEVAKLLVGGLGSMEGEEWSKSRLKLNPAFHFDKLKKMVPPIQLCCESTLNQWKSMASKDDTFTLDVFPHLQVLTGSVLAQLLFSSAYSEKLKRTFYLLTELSFMSQLASKPFVFPGERYLPTKTNTKAKEIDAEIRNLFTSMIDERLKEKMAGTRSGDPDLFDMFLDELYCEEVNKSDRKRIIDDVIGQCKIFFFAGYETNSNLLVWTMIMLSIHQNWQQRAREEVLQVLGKKSTLSYDDLGQFKSINMIVLEMLRLYPPVIELSRIVEEETKLGEFSVPKDSMITLPVLLLHRNTEIWGEDAGEFRPERFADGVLKASNGVASFLPFGWGPRICIGQNFALLEAKMFLAMLLVNFSFELSPAYTHAPCVAFTIQPQHGAQIVLRKL